MNRQLLKGHMLLHNDDNEKLADALGIHASTLYMKMQGKQPFKNSEIKIIMGRYDLTPDEIIKIFLD